MQKVYLNENNQITISCPQCKKTKNIDATPFLKKKGLVELTFRFKCDTCDCGHKDCGECKEGDCRNSNKIIIERRKFFRKKVDLSGYLVGTNRKRYPVRVLDLSRTGLRTQSLIGHPFKVDQKLQVEFTLDDARKSFIAKQIVVRKVDNKVVDGEFTDIDGYDTDDKAIGFYLMK